MALIYPWATKEYILEKMSLAQLMLYHNWGVKIKAGKLKETETYDELKEQRDRLRRSQLSKEELKRLYGDNVEGL